jgi:L-arabinose isomerase
MNKRPKIGLLTGGYFEYWKMYPGLDKIVEKEMKQLAEGLKEKIDVVWSGLSDTLEKTEEAGILFRKEDIDLLVICEGTYFPDFMPIQTIEHVPDVPVLVLLTQPHNHIPLDMDYQDAVHHSFGLVGIVQLTGAFSKMGKQFEILIGALDDASICEEVAEYAEIVTAVKNLRFMNIGIIGHTFQGMYDLELDKTKLKSKIGPNVFYLELGELLSLWRDVKDEEAVALSQEIMNKYALEGPKENDIKNSCRLGLAMEKLAEKYNLAGISHLCQHLIHVETGTTPCYAATRLIEKGVMVTCEGDIGNLVCMCLLHSLTGDIPCFLEWGMYDVKENAMLLVHHGAGSPRLAKSTSDVQITPTGEKWGFKGSGVSFRYMGKPGRVTIASLIQDKDGWKMLITAGEAIDAPCRPYYGQQFMVKVNRPVKSYLESLCREGVTHHAILIYGDLIEKLQKVTSLLGIRQFLL